MIVFKYVIQVIVKLYLRSHFVTLQMKIMDPRFLLEVLVVLVVIPLTYHVPSCLDIFAFDSNKSQFPPFNI